MKSEIIAGLDMGSGQVVCVVGRRTNASPSAMEPDIEVLGASKQICRGIKGGVVINIDETAASVQRAVEEAEDMSQEDIKSLYVALRGAHIQTFNHKGAIHIARTDKEITADDVGQVIEATKAVPISSDREILHVLAQDFILDRQHGVPNPVGMEGSLLEVEVHIVTASSNHLNNVWKAINLAGFQILEPAYGILAVGDTTLAEEEKELGCLLVDLGGQTTGVAVYAGGSVRFTKELPLGADFITQDLSHGLRTSLAQARTLKESYGAASREFAEGDVDEEISYKGVDNRTANTIRRAVLFEYIAPRVEEIFSLVGEEVRSSGFAEHISTAGAVLTGGGAMLPGMVAAAERMLEIPSRLGVPKDFPGPAEIVSDVSCATALGLLRYRHIGEWSRSKRGLRPAGIVRRFKSFVEEVF